MNVFVPRFATVALKLTCRVPLFAYRTGFFSCHESSRRLCSTVPRSKQEKVTIYFINTDGSKVAASAKVGDSLLDVVVDGNIDIDGFGACEGTLACSTCHLILKKKDYDKLPEQPTDEEQDMLDMAYGLEDTSRLGCQVYITKDMDGLEVKIPTFISDARG